jgi:hypothetical protein
MQYPSVYEAQYFPDTQTVQLTDVESKAEVAVPYPVFKSMTEGAFPAVRADRIMLRLQCGGGLKISWTAGRAGFPQVAPNYAERAIAAMMAPGAIQEERDLAEDDGDVDLLRRSFRGLIEIK